MMLFYLISCETSHTFTINADSIEKPNIHYGDSIKFNNPLKK